MDNQTNETLRQKSVKWVNWGIANVINGRIYIHKKLKKSEYRNLRKKILAHERQHDIENRYTLTDMMQDAKHTNIDLDLIFFIISTPSSWLQFSPILYYEKQLIIDRQTLYLYTLMIFAVMIGWIIL